MKQINMHEAKTHLSALVEAAVNGEPFIIAKSGKPQVVVYAYQAIQGSQSRTGFMPDLEIPDDFDSLLADDIAVLFQGETT